jgi:hypothetical protein
MSENPREAIQTDKLPDRSPDRIWGGSGAGADCAVCGAPVKSDELEFELEFRRADDRPGLDQFHAHVPCYRAWELERHELARRTNGSSRGALPDVVGERKLTSHGAARLEPERR